MIHLTYLDAFGWVCLIVAVAGSACALAGYLARDADCDCSREDG